MLKFNKAYFIMAVVHFIAEVLIARYMYDTFDKPAGPDGTDTAGHFLFVYGYRYVYFGGTHRYNYGKLNKKP